MGRVMNRKSGAYAPVFYPSIILILLFAVAGIMWPKEAKVLFDIIQNWLLTQVGWLYILGMAIFVCICIFLMFSRLGDIKLGPDHSSPEHSNLSWFSMLFAAGMGIGLMFFSVAEPLQHYLSPPDVQNGNQIAAAKDAMGITLFHWGLQAWSVYAIVGLSLAYFSYRKDLPLLPRSALYPLIGERIYGPIGHLIDIFAILGTMFGIATSLGLGATQVNAGLHYLFSVPTNTTVETILIIIITLFATTSVALGLEKGIKVVSNFNIIVALVLLLFILITGSTTLLLQSFVQNTGNYFSSIISKTFNLYAYENKQGWLSGWTLFYWGWWIAWSPFVGMFIAKVSKGRSIREFIIGVLFIPTGFTFLWLSVFGNSAISLALSNHGHALVEAVQTNVPVALFSFLQYFPFSTIISIIALVLVVTFFVTSSDSGSLVIDIIATGNAKKSITWQRIFWSLLEGLLAISLLYSGGLLALQTATIASAFPFLIILFFMCIALIKALREDFLKLSSIQTHTTSVQYIKANATWQKRLDSLLQIPTKNEADVFLQTTIIPAIKEVKSEFDRHHVSAKVKFSAQAARLSVDKFDEDDFVYSVRLCQSPTPEYLSDDDTTAQDQYYRAEVFLEHGGQHYDVMGYTKEQLIADVITQYEKHLHYLHLSGS